MPNRIREVRKLNGMTMKQLGAEIGVAESTVSQYETGKREPDNETLLRIGELFNVTVGYLLGAEEQKENPTSQKTGEVDDVTMELLDIIQNGTNEDRQDLLEMYRIIKKRRETR